MKRVKLTASDNELIEHAKQVISNNYSGKEPVISTVGSALRTKSGKIFKGVNMFITTSAPTSICAETSAIAQMISTRKENIDTIVSLWVDGNKWDVFSSCGACRHIISNFGNPWIIISKKQKIRLNELYPEIPE